MPTTRRPRRGSLQYWPRKRARRIYPRIKSWSGATGLLGFAGYKAGMTHTTILDNTNSTTKGTLITVPVTVIECPPLKTASLLFYKKTHSGPKIVYQLWNKSLDKELARKISLPKKFEADEKKLSTIEYDELRLLVYTQPKLTGIGKKKPEIFEISTNSKDLTFTKQFFEKEINIDDVFHEGEQLDVHAVTKGKGLQGPIKRFGLRIRQHKSEKTKRGPGSLGPWHPNKVSYTVPHAGQMGYHTRTEYNKLCLKISNDLEKVNQKGGFVKYGLVANKYVLVKGSTPGSRNRLLLLTKAIRPNKKIQEKVSEIKYISIESKQSK